MASITYWNRLEARSRSNDLSQSLAARVHDPAWFLARQWQVGEFRGEDAASPAFMSVSAELVPFSAWSAGETSQALDGRAPLEKPLELEPFSADDVTTSVELGRAFARLLEFEHAGDLLTLFRNEYRIQPHADDDAHSAALRALWTGRVVDGLALYHAARTVAPALPPPATPGRENAVRAALEGLVRWVDEIYPAFGTDDHPGWVPERLEYASTVTAANAEVGAVLTPHASADGRLDWYSFDAAAQAPPAADGEARSIQWNVIPGAVLFRGMPQPRFWDFEDRRIDFGGLTPDRRDLARLIFMDFMLVHGNDWFVLPFEQPLGTLCRIPSLVVRDVFGGDTQITRGETAGAARWSMFSTSRAGGGNADWFCVPPSAGPALQMGPDLEDVRFLRDQTANMAWAVERATESHLGAPLPALDRDPDEPRTPAPTTSSAPLRYLVQTSVPSHWIPFVPVKIDSVSSEIALELASLLDPSGPEGALPLIPEPRGKILRPSALNASYRLREEEIPREGTRVTRSLRLSRWTDGSTHLWIARRRTVGGGEGWAGLRFDVALRNRD